MVAKYEEYSHQLTGIAGVHYVAGYLSYLGYHAVPTTRNVKGPDLLVSNASGSKAVSLQVKTTWWAMRTRGRGADKKPHHYEWDVGWSSAKLRSPRVLFALVDLKDFEELPDVFLVPSRVIYNYFDGGDPATWRRARYHPAVKDIDRYLNNWALLKTVMR